MSDRFSPTLISVIIPTHNRAWSLPRALDSLIHQTNPQWEAVVVDDGSTDDTKNVIGSYLKDSRIKYYFQENQGVGSARNTGVAKAHAEYVTFLDSDDELESFAIQQLVDDIPLLMEHKVTMLLYPIKKIENAAYEDSRFSDKQVISYNDAIRGLWPKIDTMELIIKGVFRSHGFPEEGNGLEGLLWYSILRDIAPALFRVVPALYIYHTEHDSRLTGTGYLTKRASSMVILYNELIAKFGDDFKRLNPKRLGYYYLEKAVFELISGDKGSCRISLKKSLSYNKMKLPIVLGIGAISLLPIKASIRVLATGHTFKNLLK